MIHSLEQILNKDHYSKTSNTVEVIEIDPKSKVKKVQFSANKYEIFALDRKFIENSNILLKCDSCKELKSICDGLFLIEKENNFHLFLVELKSSFSTQEYNKAKQQIEASFSKLNVLLTCFEKYDIKICQIHSFIIGLDLAAEKQGHLLKVYQSGTKDPDYVFCFDLIWKKKFEIKKENSIFKDTPLKFKGFDVVYFPYEEIEQTGIDLSLYL